MSAFDAVQDLDGQGRPIFSPLPFLSTKRMTFAGGTTNDPGDYDGTGNPATLFTVTGDVLIYPVFICKTTLVGGATLKVGTTDVDAYILSMDDASTVLANQSQESSTGFNYIGQADFNSTNGFTISGGQDIIQTVGTANITAGVMDYYCFWRPLSSDGNVVAA